MTTKKTPAPKELGTAGKALWNQIAGQVAGDGLQLDARELRLLRDACRTADDLEVIEAALQNAPALVLGSTGQSRPQPLLDEARKARALIATLLRQIDLADESARKPQGHRGGYSSTQARAAVMSRRAGA